MKLVEALQIANTNRDEGAPFHVLLCCGFTPLHLEPALKAHLRLSLPDRNIKIRTGLYGDPAGTLENAPENLDAIIVVLEWGDLDPRLAWRSPGRVNEDVISDARSRLDRIRKSIAVLAQKTPVALALPTLPLAPVFHTPGGELNRVEAALREMLYGFAATTPAIVLHTGTMPNGNRHDLRAELTNGFPYSFAHADALAAGLVKSILPLLPKKALITDLDQTLWSGVLGDDGPEGITWDLDHKTQFHSLYQFLLNQLAEAGAMIGVASKNDADLVHTALKREDLIINPKHLFPVEAHWQPKPESIERILAAWNIGADSVVFVDDDPLQLMHVKAAFPAMECLEFRKDDAKFLIDLHDLFGKREIREEDTLRVASLRSGQVLRQVSDSASLDTVLEGAQARVTFRWGKNPPDPRALELINKTNQFKLNSLRYTETDWKNYLADPATRLVVVDYQDRFGKLGKIAALAGREQDGGFEVDVWVMSCRAFSRRIEYQCLKQLLDHWEPVQFRWERTERNGPMRDFLAEMVPGQQTIDRAEFNRRSPALFHQTECKVD